MSNTKIEDSIISAVEILTDRAISKAGFDKTIQGTIKRCENKAAGQYVIKYQDSTFYAYAASPDITYSNNTLVYVLVPGGDFRNDKTILGAVSKLGKDYITMVGDDEAYEVIGQNIFASKDTFELQSYGIEPYIKDITHLINVDEYSSYIRESNYLQIKAKIKATIDSDQQEGSYYLSIKTIFEDKSGKEVEREYKLGSMHVAGNPYRLSAPTLQSYIYPIDGMNFKSIEGVYLVKEGFTVDASKAIDDVWFSNIEINAVEPIVFSGDGKLSLGIITAAGKVVNNNYPSELSLEAIVKSKGAVYSSKAEYIWFIEDGRTAAGDRYSTYAGYGWKRLDTASNLLTVPASDIIAKENRYRCIAIVDGIVLSKIVVLRNLNSEYDLKIISSNGTEFFLDNGEFTLDAILSNSQGTIDKTDYSLSWYSMDNRGAYEPLTNINNIQVNTIEGFKKYHSVAYDNHDRFVASAEVTITNSAQGGGYSLVIRNSDKVYKYDEKGISPCSDSRQNPMRIPELSFEVYDPDGKLCFDSSSGLGGNKITWLIPADDSLIEPYVKNADDLSPDGQNYIFTTGTLEYKISNYYRATKTRKQIQLIVNYNGNVLTTSTNFTFTKEGGNGTNGTSYTVVIREKDGGTNLYRELYFNTYKDGELTTESFTNIKWSILKKDRNTYTDLSIVNENAQDAEINIADWDTQGDSLSSSDIIKLECKAPDGNYIYSYFPIVRYHLDDIDIIGGVGEILFNTDLTASEYDDDLFEVINLDKFGSDIEVRWSIRPVDNNTMPNGTLIFNDTNIGNTFSVRVQKQYDGSTNNAVICRIYDTNTGLYIAEKKIPIYVGVNRYSNSALNGWDGSNVQIDDKGDMYILAPQIGAGVKNSDNSFTGIVMGTQKSTSTNDKTGLFGFSSGQEVFCLDAENGSATFRNGDFEIAIDPANNKDHVLRATNNNKDVFYIKKDGTLFATKGQIGVWEITDGKYFKSGNIWMHPEGVSATVNSKTSNFVFYTNGNFGVDTKGDVYFNAGKVGPWTISSSGMKCGEAWLEENAIACGNAGGTFIKMFGSGSSHGGYLLVSADGTTGMKIFVDRIERNGTNLLNGLITIGDVKVAIKTLFDCHTTGGVNFVTWKNWSNWENSV